MAQMTDVSIDRLNRLTHQGLSIGCRIADESHRGVRVSRKRKMGQQRKMDTPDVEEDNVDTRHRMEGKSEKDCT